MTVATRNITNFLLFETNKNTEVLCVNRTIKHTVVSEKNGTFICELVMERYIYVRKTLKQQKITSYGGNKSFLEFYLVYNGVCLKLLRSLL